jgi:hypothetical protein
MKHLILLIHCSRLPFSCWKKKGNLDHKKNLCDQLNSGKANNNNNNNSHVYILFAQFF